MAQSADIAVAAAVLLPFATAALLPPLHRLVGDLAGWAAALVAAAAFAAFLTVAPDIHGAGTLTVAVPWVPSWGIELSFLIDGLSLTFALAISGIGALIFLYVSLYLHGHPHQGRFLAFLMAFMGAMQGLVLADNLLALYLFWELTSVTSFLLIGFDHARQAARRAAVQALLVTGLGGLALLAAGVVLHQLSGHWTLSAMTGPLTQGALYPLLVALVLLAAFTKSAQLPFHFWLPNAMEAPTPVSAYLHSATMVQAGVYLVLRMTPHLGGEPIWNGTLMLFGGATLLWGAIAAIRQTDLKQLLAQTTLASLGLLMLLAGIGTELAIVGAILYFVAHALYKAGLFLVAGAIDHGTGTRDVTQLGGLRDAMTMSFIAALLGGAAMLGLPPLAGFFAKEEMYAALVSAGWGDAATLAVLVAGNGILGAVALVVALRPFLGPLRPTPAAPHEASPTMLAGPLLLGLTGAGLAFAPDLLLGQLVMPAAEVILAQEAHAPYLGLKLLSPAFLLSLLTWAIAVLVWYRIDALRARLLDLDRRLGWSFDKGFDAVYFALVGLADRVTRLLHHGRLELYLLVAFVGLGLSALVPLLVMGGLPGRWRAIDLTFYEWGIVLIAVIGLVTVVAARTRLFAILALGVQGVAVATLFLLFGAPDLSFTQFMVEILSVVILALVMTRLNLEPSDSRPLEDWARDGAVAVFAGYAVTMLLFAVLEGSLDPRLSMFFNAHSAPVAHGHNVVNVILVDFRGLDTLGEISVVMTAGIAVLALIRGARRPRPAPPPERPAPRRRAKKGAAA